MEERKCKKCQNLKPLDDFYTFRSRGNLWRRRTCKTCYLNYQKGYGDAHLKRGNGKTPQGFWKKNEEELKCLYRAGFSLQEMLEIMQVENCSSASIKSAISAYMTAEDKKERKRNVFRERK